MLLQLKLRWGTGVMTLHREKAMAERRRSIGGVAIIKGDLVQRRSEELTIQN